MTPAIFLSYASQDADAALRICEALRAAGLEVWFDQSELRGGDAWDASIRKQIKECALFVPMISESTNSRSEGYFRLEWKLAVDRSHLMADDQPFFLPVILDDTPEASARVPDRFRERQWTRLKDESAVTAFAERVGKVLSRSGPSGIRAPNAAPVLKFTTAQKALAPKVDEGFWVAVLPFKHRGGGADVEALAEGMSEEIVTGLSRFSYLRVIARSATLQLTGEAADVRAIGKELGARYVMDGNLRQAGATLRVSVQLVDASTGAHLWAETYDRPFKAEDIFALQDDLVPRIVSTVADPYGVLPRSMNEAVSKIPHAQMTPYEAMLRGFEGYERFTIESHAMVRDCLEHAVRNAPGNGTCWAMLSLAYANEHAFGSNVLPDSLGRALDAARRGVDLGPTNHVAHQALAHTLFFRKEFVGARNAVQRSLKLNPMDGSNIAEAGRILALTGDWERGCAMIEQGMALNANLPSWFWMASAFNAYRKHEYRAALEAAVKTNVPLFVNLRILIAAAYGQLGDREAGGKALLKLHTDKPGFVALANEWLEKWFDAEMIEHLFDGLRKAGLETIAADAKPVTANVAIAPLADKDASIAVLAFANRSASADDEYFSDGLADELLNVLARIKGLRVAARTSAFSFKGKQATVAEIGRALNVATVLEGSVRKSGNRARVSVELVKVSDGYHLWSETYDRTLDDIFAVQDDIAQAVVKELRTTLMGEASVEAKDKTVAAEIAKAATERSDNSEAQRLFIHARFLLNRKSERDLMQSIDDLKQAVAIDPGFALAWAWLAQALGEAGGWGTMPVHEANAEALLAAQKALALAPDLVQAHAALAYVQTSYQWDFVAAEASIRHALKLAPDNADVLTSALRLSFCLRRFDEAEQFGRRAIGVDPLNAISYRHLAMSVFSAGNVKEAIHLMHQALELAPDGVASRHVLGIMLSAQGRFDEALAETMLEKAEWARLTGVSIVRWQKSVARGTAADKTESDKALATMVKKHGNHSAVQISHLYAIRGDADSTFEWLERAYQQRDAGLTYSNALPLFDPIKSDPRWVAFVKKMGLGG